MIKLNYETSKRDYSPRFAIIDYDTENALCDSDDLVDLYLSFQKIANDALEDNRVLKERISAQYQSLKQF